MEALLQDYAQVLLEDREPPCLSLYQPTHRHFPQNRQDPIRFKNLTGRLQSSLEQLYPGEEFAALLAPLQQLRQNEAFWNHTLDGLAVFAARDFFRVYRLQGAVPELALAADSFHTKPLVRILQSLDRYQILAFDRSRIRLFEGNRHALDEVSLDERVPATITDALGEELTEPYLTPSARRGSAGGQGIFHGHGSKKDEVDLDAERFFRAVDRAIDAHHSSVSRLPLMLAALPEHQALFRRISRNAQLADASIDVHPDSLSADALRERAWQAVEPIYRARLESVTSQFHDAQAKGLGADELSSIARAAVAGRVQTLLISADQHIGGRIDEEGVIERGEIDSPDLDDVLDDLGELVLKRGGETFVLPADRMPTKTGAAAIYRY